MWLPQSIAEGSYILFLLLQRWKSFVSHSTAAHGLWTWRFSYRRLAFVSFRKDRAPTLFNINLKERRQGRREGEAGKEGETDWGLWAPDRP